MAFTGGSVNVSLIGVVDAPGVDLEIWNEVELEALGAR